MTKLRVDLFKDPIMKEMEHAIGVERTNSIRNWMLHLEPVHMWQSCASCHHLINDRFCAKHNATPPASVIVTGCPQYSDEENAPF